MRNLLRFELVYQTSQRIFPVACFAFLAMGFLLTASGFGPSRVALLSPWLLAEATGFLSLLAVFPAAIFTSQAVLRDDQHQMVDLVFATPITRAEYLGSRFAGAFSATFAVLCLAPLGMIAASFLPSQPAERLAPLDVRGLILALLLIALPAVAFASSLLFGIAVFTRSTLATSVGSLALYFLYFVAASATNSPMMAASKAGDGSALGLAAWLDPFGLSSFFHHTLFWTVAEQNSRLPYGGVLLLNRLGTLALAGLFLYRAFRQFRRENKSRDLPRSIGKPKEASDSLGNTPGTVWSSKLWLELRWLAASWPLWLTLALWLILAATEIANQLFQGEYGSALLPTSGAIVQTLEQPFRLFGLVLLVYFSTELLWLGEQWRLENVFAATPARSRAFVAAKWLLLALLVFGLGVATILLGMTFQLALGYPHFEPKVYLAFLAYSGTPLLIFAAATVLVHRLAKNRHLGLFACLLLALLMEAGPRLGIEHPLLQFAQAPRTLYSGLAGFAGTLFPATAFLGYWSILALICLIFAAAIWRRGEKPGWRQRRPLLAACATLFAVTGGMLFHQTNIVRTWESSEERIAWKAEYEKKYRHEAMPQPRPESLQAKIAFYPREGRATLEGRYRLANRTERPIETLWVQVPRIVRSPALDSPRAHTIEMDERFAISKLHLSSPLEPGESFDLDFSLEVGDAGISGEGPDPAIVENGSFLAGWRYLPRLGYQPSYEIDDPRERQKRGLEAAPSRSEQDSGHAGEAEDPLWIDFEIEVSTASDQIAIGPGRLVRSWQEGDRAHFLYDSAGRKLTHTLAFLSADYEALRSEPTRPGGPVIEVHAGPRQPENARKVLEVASRSLALFEELFQHPYPLPVLRLAEIPGYWPFGGFATPGTILLVENRTFELDTRDERRFDLLARRVAHEVAHQWWGHNVSPAPGPGASVLVESLAKYSELRALEALHGKEEVRRLLEIEEGRYLAERSTQKEAPLAESQGQAYLFYRKGALATHAIAAAMGEEHFDAALAALLAEQGGPGKAPTVETLIAELEARATPEARERIDELLRAIVLYDFELVELRSKEDPQGGFEVELEIEGHKWQSDGDGSEQELAFAAEVPIAITSASGEELLAVNLTNGRNHITLPSAHALHSISLDPDFLFIDKTRWNNRKTAG